MAIITANIGTDNYTTTIRAGNNTIVSDEDAKSGGKDLGLNPMELIAAALGSCTCITLKMYAQRKEYKLLSVEVKVDFNRDVEANFSNVQRDIVLTGDLTQAQKDRLLLIANRCPVHQTLTHTISISTKIV
ncbi:MAG: OsmC family protein [Bacteroidota bacterium]